MNKFFLAFLLTFSLAGLNSCSEDEPSSDDNQEVINPPEEDKGQDKEETEDDPSGNPEDENKEMLEKYGLYYVDIPQDIPSQIKEYTGFTLSFNKDNHTPNYVTWELLASETNGSVNRQDYDFWQDTDLEGCPDKNYQYSIYGYERGHMCPAADQKWSKEAMRDCFVMANMCPQMGELNGGAWENLEKKARAWAARDEAIWIVAGPIYLETDTQTIGTYNVRVPSGFFKAFLKYDGENSRAIAFAYPNSDAPGGMVNYAMSIDQLEEVLGYDFFPALPDDIENRIEAEYSISDWY